MGPNGVGSLLTVSRACRIASRERSSGQAAGSRASSCSSWLSALALMCGKRRLNESNFRSLAFLGSAIPERNNYIEPKRLCRAAYAPKGVEPSMPRPSSIGAMRGRMDQSPGNRGPRGPQCVSIMVPRRPIWWGVCVLNNKFQCIRTSML